MWRAVDRAPRAITSADELSFGTGVGVIAGLVGLMFFDVAGSTTRVLSAPRRGPIPVPRVAALASSTRRRTT